MDPPSDKTKQNTLSRSHKRRNKQLKKELERARAANAAESSVQNSGGDDSRSSIQPTEPEPSDPPSLAGAHEDAPGPGSIGGSSAGGIGGTVNPPPYTATHQHVAGASTGNWPTYLAPVNRPPDRETRQHAANDTGNVFLYVYPKTFPCHLLFHISWPSLTVMFCSSGLTGHRC